MRKIASKRERRKRKQSKNSKPNLPNIPNLSSKESPKQNKQKRKSLVQTVAILLAIFVLVLFLNSYFNYTSGVAINPSGTTLETKYLLSGPDPYYNMRICKDVLETGNYNYLNPYDKDPLLNYPMGGRGIRPPLFNMICVASTQILSNFAPQMDALGLSMLFLPAIYGALIVFPVYHIGRDLFNKKVGIIASLLIPLIPIHIGGSHGSSLSLFDHDSFLFLLSAILFMFIIKGLREKSYKKSIIFSALSGITLGSIYLTWTAARFFFIILMLYISIQFLIDIIRLDKQKQPYMNIITTSIVALLVSFPYMLIREEPFSFPLILLAFSIAVFAIKEANVKLNMPWLISIPILGAVVSSGLGFIYLISVNIISAPIPAFKTFANMLFGSGIYGSKISTTIAEAGAYNISQTVMSFGIALYWFAILGIILYFYQSNKDKYQSHNIFFLSLTIIYLWLSTTAGRFVNDLIPFVAVLSAYFIFSILDKIDYKQLIKTYKANNSIRSSIRVKHIAGILLVAFLVVLPNTYMSFDAAVPANMKQEVFGSDFQGANGLSLGKSAYWADACSWIAKQDINKTNKPAVISWWDYGFYISALSDHPTVADNFQEGIPPAANFLTSQSESEAIAVLTIRLIEGEKVAPNTGDIIKGKINKHEIISLIHQYFPENGTTLINILEDPEKYAPSYNTLVSKSYNNTIYRVTSKNAMYQDATSILLTLTEEQLINFHHLVESYTGHSIRYFATEQYDRQIFVIFPFLSDKGTFMRSTYEDDFFKTIYIDKNNKEYTEEDLQLLTQQQADDLEITSRTKEKPAYYNSLWYRTWFGQQGLQNRIPTFGLKHFYLQYNSPYVVIAKYYPGSIISGNITLNNNIKFNSITTVLNDELGISHDINVSSNGTYSIIAPAGDNTINFYIGNTLIKSYNITTTEQEANRITNYRKTHNININYSQATITSNVTATSVNIKDLYFNTYNQTIPYSNQLTLTDMVPSLYTINLLNETGETITTENVFLKPNNNNITIGE